MAVQAKLIAKTRAAGVFLNRLFCSFPSWKGHWFILDQSKERKGIKGKWLLIAPVGHPWDKLERWVNASCDKHFTVLVNPTH